MRPLPPRSEGNPLTLRGGSMATSCLWIPAPSRVYCSRGGGSHSKQCLMTDSQALE